MTTARAIVVNPTGDIVQEIVAAPTMLALQLSLLHGPGDALFTLDDHGGAFIDQTQIALDEEGALVAKPGFTPDIPPMDIYFITANEAEP